jgi:hypothetical protein
MFGSCNKGCEGGDQQSIQSEDSRHLGSHGILIVHPLSHPGLGYIKAQGSSELSLLMCLALQCCIHDARGSNHYPICMPFHS